MSADHTDEIASAAALKGTGAAETDLIARAQRLWGEGKSKRAVAAGIGKSRIWVRSVPKLGGIPTIVAADLPFGPRNARRLMAIATDARIANRTLVSVMAESIGTLYELTRLDDATFEALPSNWGTRGR
jgi:hypothetical protein